MKNLDLKRLLLGTSLLTAASLIGVTQVAHAQDGASDKQLFAAVQQTGDDDCVDPITGENTCVSDEEVEEIIVTGSRIKRSTFDSIKPLQTIEFDDARQVGLLDTIEILQTSEAAAGTQIDSSFSGFVTDNGPGSETINLRGLGAGRTLVLVNGRRLAPLGVEGAPSQASINSIPSVLVQRADLLLEGASSVYGSDAVSGVINVILDTDFEGFQVEASTEIAEQGGEDYTIGVRYGINLDRGFAGIGLEYDRRDVVTQGDRDFFAGCETNFEIDENGQIRTLNVENEVLQEIQGISANPLDINNPCLVGGTTSRFIELSPGVPFGSVFANSSVPDGVDFLNIPGFTDPFVFFPVDADGDDVADQSLRQFSINGNNNSNFVISPQDRFNLFAFGEYTLDGPTNLTPYFEVLYSRTENEQDFGSAQLFPVVGADNPFNPCGVNGVDCGSSAAGPGGIFTSPSFIEDFNTFQRDIDPNRDGDTRDARICATFGIVDVDGDGVADLGSGPFDNAACTPALFGLGAPTGPIDVQPVVTIDGDRDSNEIVLQQTRLVGGFKGDLYGLNFDGPGPIELSDWTFDVSVSHNISSGTASRPGIREDRLNLALGNSVVQTFVRDADGNLILDANGDPQQEFAPGDVIPGLAPCEVQDSFEVSSVGGLGPDTTTGCVPVNLFTPEALEIFGSLSDAEAAFLFDSRDFDTQFTQTIWNGFITGKLATLPAGDLNAGFGFEWREDRIESIPDNVAADGLFFGFFSDQGATGSRFIREFFGEFNIPLLADQPFARSLDFDAGFRVLEDEFFGGAAVYSLSAGWRPVDSLLVRGSWGTSFRAPNLRELFLEPQSGFVGVFDPCVVGTNTPAPPGSPPGTAATFDPALDTRDQDVIEACLAQGLPQDFGAAAGFTPTPQVEVFTQGSTDLDPETSTSLTIGASWEQPFFDSFTFNAGVNYFDVEVEGAVVSPGAQFTIGQCFSEVQSAFFCDSINRSIVDQQIESVDLNFVNQDTEQVRGLDFNFSYAQEFTAFERPFTFQSNVRLNHLLERETLFLDDDGNPTTGIFQGEFGFPDWTGSGTARLIYKDFAFNWFTRFVGAQQDTVFTQTDADEGRLDTTDDFANAFGIDTDDDGFADTFSETCLGPDFGDVNCRDVDFTNAYFVHNASINYNNADNDFSITLGINNVFNRDPEQISANEGQVTISNVPLGLGFNTNGRTFVAQIRKGF